MSPAKDLTPDQVGRKGFQKIIAKEVRKKTKSTIKINYFKDLH